MGTPLGSAQREIRQHYPGPGLVEHDAAEIWAATLACTRDMVEQAGGAATNGHQRILDVQPAKLHERVAVFLGSKNEVDRVTGYHRGG